MILGSHNSWSYARPKKWWMKLLRFTAKCQDVDIRGQYEDYGVRCFDLRIREKDGRFIIAHGLIEYSITLGELQENLRYLNKKGDACVRLILEIRTEKALPSIGAGFIVALSGDIIRMPGLPKEPAAERMDIVDGKIVGLF